MAMYRPPPPPPPPSDGALCPSCLLPHFPFCPSLHLPFLGTFPDPSTRRSFMASGGSLLPPPAPPQMLQRPPPPPFCFPPPAEAFNPSSPSDSRFFPGHDYSPQRPSSSHGTNGWIGKSAGAGTNLAIHRDAAPQWLHGGASGIDNQRDFLGTSNFADRAGELSGLSSRSTEFSWQKHGIGSHNHRPDNSNESARSKRQRFEGVTKKSSLPLLSLEEHEELKGDSGLLKKSTGHKPEGDLSVSEDISQVFLDDRKQLQSQAPVGVGDEKLQNRDLESGSFSSSKLKDNEATKHIEKVKLMPEMRIGRDNSDIAICFQQHTKEPISRGEELTIEHGFQASGMSREDRLLVERALQSTYSRRLDSRPLLEQTFVEHGLREQAISWRELGKQPEHYGHMGKQRQLSREEELLIEKGLLDDSSHDVSSYLSSHPSDWWLYLKKEKLGGGHELEVSGHHSSKFYGSRWSDFPERLMNLQCEQLLTCENSEGYFSSERLLDPGMLLRQPADIENSGIRSIGNFEALPHCSRDGIGVKRWDAAMERASFEDTQSTRGEKLNRSKDTYLHESPFSKGWVSPDRERLPYLVKKLAPVQTAERHFAEESRQQRLFFQHRNLGLRTRQHHATPLNPLQEVSQEAQQQQYGIQQTSSDPASHLKDVHLQHQSQFQQRQQIPVPWQELLEDLPEANKTVSEAQFKSLQQSSILQLPSLNHCAYSASERNSYLNIQQSSSQEQHQFSRESEYEQHGTKSQCPHPEFPAYHRSQHIFEQEMHNSASSSAPLTSNYHCHSHQHHTETSEVQNFKFEQRNMQHQRNPEQQEAQPINHQHSFQEKMSRLQHFPSDTQQFNAQMQRQPSPLLTKQTNSQVVEPNVQNFSQQMQEQRQQKYYHAAASGESQSFQSMAQTVLTSSSSQDGLLVPGRLPETSLKDAATRQVFPYPRLQQEPFTVQPAFPVIAPADSNTPLLPEAPTAWSTPEQNALNQSFQIQKQSDFTNQNQISEMNAVQREKSRTVDAVSIFKNPGRVTRPDHFVVILRGLPGSGKSYLAKALRDVEVSNGGSAPRIHSIDDYFMAEVEKVEDNEPGKSTLRSKKKVVQKVMEYSYEPEMEEAYRASMFKAFRKTLEEGLFTFVIVDDRNILVADFAQFWATAKRSGYEAYVLEAPYKDPLGCAARNVHGFTIEQVQSMADRWELTPSIYYKLDVLSLFRGDDLNSEQITEVEMDADDMECDADGQETDFRLLESGEHSSPPNKVVEKRTVGGRWDDEATDDGGGINHDKPYATSNQASDDRDSGSSNDSDINVDAGGALSGLMKAYGKKDKSVHWADYQDGVGGNKGFSIGAVKGHLIIGPGSGYNENSNPVVEAQDSPIHTNHGASDLKRSTKFLEQLRAEQEAFKAAFARRRHRISGMDEMDD